MFRLIKILGGRINVPEPEKHLAGAEIKDGMSLVLSGGKVSPAKTKPTHIAIGNAKNGEKVACYAVTPEMIFEVACTAAPAAEGSLVTINTDYLKVTATTTDGVATVVSKNGATKAGDKILVKFA